MLNFNRLHTILKFKQVGHFYISTFVGPSKFNPIVATLKSHLLRYLTPSTITYTWSFGSMLGLYFILQILTGL
jgi:quinol-cytochrome oxidoreductase complex cytochrome b subunit